MSEEKINDQQNPKINEPSKKQPPVTLILVAATAVCLVLAVVFLVLWLGAKNNAPADPGCDGSSSIGNNDNQSEDKKDEISVNTDGYVVVNGVITEILADKEDVITVKDGYLVVNGVKTNHRIHTEPVISVVDGYVAVNGVKTEYEVNKSDVITVKDGYLVVNGVKTEYEVKINNHSFGDWRLYNEGETDCEKKLYYRTCADCSTIEWKEGNYEDHSFKTVTTKPTCQAGGYDTKTCTLCGKAETLNETPKTGHNFVGQYYYDADYHWRKCSSCGESDTKAAHIMDNGICMVCDPSVQPTEGIAYDISADGTYAEVIGYSGTATKIKIADTYNGLPVKSIYSGVFKNNYKITSVIIPDSVTIIGSDAFYYCSSLTSIVIPDSVRGIGNQAFYRCSKLTSVVIGDSVTSIGSFAFYYCSSLTSIVIPDSVTIIGSDAFSGCSSLTSVVIPDSVTKIGDYAFKYCSSLTSVVIGDSVTSIGSSAFSGCSSLTSVVIGDSVTSIGDYAFYDCSKLITEYNYCKYVASGDNPYAVLIDTTNDNLSTYEIHPDTRIIASSAFSCCYRLTSIVIPDSVRGIGHQAFFHCSKLTSVVIPDSVTSIGNEAFKGCSALTSIVIPDSVTSIGYDAFYNCDSLTDVYYTGSKEDWQEISLGFNYNLTGANIHYNYIPE